MPTVDSLDIQISAQAQNAEKALDSLISKLNLVKGSLGSVSSDTKKLGSDATQTSKKSKEGWELANKGAKEHKNTFQKLTSTIGKFYSQYIMAVRGIKKLWASIETTADYVEAYNYFDVALGKIGADWSHQWEKYSEKLGVTSAEEYANSFKSRLQSSLSGLSGVSIEVDADGNGLLTETGMKNLGLNIQEVTQYVSQLASVTNSAGLNGETSLAASSAFTKLGADMSSLFNMDYSSVMKNLQSGLIGQSRALYKYGIDITQATLETYAYNAGIKKSVSEMTQSEKMQLRMLAILDQSKVAWGDLANTIASPSNMIRQFKNNLKELSMVFGQLFLPVLQKVMPFANGVTIAIKDLFTTIAGFFGIKIDLSSFGQGYTDIEDGADGATDSVEDLTDATKKLKNATLGIDELNINNPKKDKDTSGGSGIDLTDEILKATEEYEKVWQEAYDNMEDIVQKWANRIEKALKPVKKLFEDISIGDWFAVGQDVSTIASGIFSFFSRAIKKVDWYKVGKKAGDFFAGIEWTRILTSVVKAIFESLESVLELSAGMFSTAPLETTLIYAFSSTKLFKALTASKIIKGVVSLKKNLSTIVGKLTSLQRGAIGLVAVFGEFFAVREGFYDITMGAENLVATIGKIVTSAGLASAALYTAFGPVGLAVAAIAGITGAISGVDKALQDQMQIEIYGQELDTLVDKINNTTEALNKRIEVTNEYIENAGVAEMGAISKLADEYFDLAEQENLTNEEKDRMVGLASLLVGSFEPLKKFYNDETGLIDTTRQSVENLIRARLDEIKINAMEDKLTEIYKNQQEALEAATEAQKIHLASQEELEKRMEESNYNYWVEKMDYSTKLSNLRQQLKDTTGDTTALQAEIQEVYNLLTDNGKNPQWDDFATLSWAYEQAVGNVEAFKDEFNQTLEAWQKADAVYVEATKAWDKYSGMLANAMSGAATDAISGYNGVIESDDTMSEASYNAAKQNILSFAEGQESHSPSKAYARLAHDAMDGFTLGLEEREKKTRTFAIKFAKNIVGSFSEPMKNSKQIGVDLIQGVIDGLSSMEETLYKKVSEIGNNISNSLKTTLDIHSPSRVMFEIGTFTMEGFKEGIENIYKPILSSVKNFGIELPKYAPLTISDSYTNSMHDGILNSTERAIREDYRFAETNELLRTQNSLLSQLLEKEVRIGDKQIAQANRRGQKLLGVQLVT